MDKMMHEKRRNKMKWNTKINILQFVIAIFSFIQLIENAIFMALISVFIIYLLGAFENSGCDFNHNDA